MSYPTDGGIKCQPGHGGPRNAEWKDGYTTALADAEYARNRMTRMRAWVDKQLNHKPDPDRDAQLLAHLRRNLAREVERILDGDE